MIVSVYPLIELEQLNNICKHINKANKTAGFSVSCWTRSYFFTIFKSHLISTSASWRWPGWRAWGSRQWWWRRVRGRGWGCPRTLRGGRSRGRAGAPPPPGWRGRCSTGSGPNLQSRETEGGNFYFLGVKKKLFKCHFNLSSISVFSWFA